MERKDVCHQITAKFLCVTPIPLALDEFPPCLKKILNTNDIFIRMSELTQRHPREGTPPPTLLPVLQKLKAAYLLWFSFYPTVPKIHRYTLAQRTDGLMVEVIEAVAAASFAPRPEKLPFVRLAIRKLDTLKILLLVLWESRSLDTNKYATISQPLDEVGRMLGGWHGQLVKQNSPRAGPNEK